MYIPPMHNCWNSGASRPRVTNSPVVHQLQMDSICKSRTVLNYDSLFNWSSVYLSWKSCCYQVSFKHSFAYKHHKYLPSKSCTTTVQGLSYFQQGDVYHKDRLHCLANLLTAAMLSSNLHYTAMNHNHIVHNTTTRYTLDHHLHQCPSHLPLSPCQHSLDTETKTRQT